MVFGADKTTPSEYPGANVKPGTLCKANMEPEKSPVEEHSSP